MVSGHDQIALQRPGREGSAIPQAQLAWMRFRYCLIVSSLRHMATAISLLGRA